MARKMTYDGVGEIEKVFQDLGSNAYGIVKRGLYAGAGTLTDEIRKNTPYDEGDLRDSLFINQFHTTLESVDTFIGFAGYDRDGVPNPLKAAVLESGTRDGKKKATHFFSKAVRAAEEKTKNAIGFAIDRAIYEIKKG